MIKNRGITLVALVVTIVILLILAGISINLLIGQNGIVTRTTDAKKAYENDEENTQLGLNGLDQEAQNAVDEAFAPGEPADKEVMKIVVNSGDNGLVVLPFPSYDSCTVDWGDGTIDTASLNKRNILTKIATTKVMKLAAGAIGKQHQYPYKDTEYEVKITGTISRMMSASCIITDETAQEQKNKIIKITQWGETGVTQIKLYGCRGLTQIASPTANSFVNITDFGGSFEECTALQSIPADFFKYCNNIDSYTHTFRGCTSLTGNAPEIWKSGTNSAENDYWGEPCGLNCFLRCTGLSNYDAIPNAWKNSME